MRTEVGLMFLALINVISSSEKEAFSMGLFSIFSNIVPGSTIASKNITVCHGFMDVKYLLIIVNKSNDYEVSSRMTGGWLVMMAKQQSLGDGTAVHH